MPAEVSSSSIPKSSSIAGRPASRTSVRTAWVRPTRPQHNCCLLPAQRADDWCLMLCRPSLQKHSRSVELGLGVCAGGLALLRLELALVQVAAQLHVRAHIRHRHIAGALPASAVSGRGGAWSRMRRRLSPAQGGLQGCSTQGPEGTCWAGEPGCWRSYIRWEAQLQAGSDASEPSATQCTNCSSAAGAGQTWDRLPARALASGVDGLGPPVEDTCWPPLVASCTAAAASAAGACTAWAQCACGHAKAVCTGPAPGQLDWQCLNTSEDSRIRCCQPGRGRAC